MPSSVEDAEFKATLMSPPPPVAKFADADLTPSPRNPMGAKGIGEAATIGATPAIVNAVVDALKSFGVRHVDMPLRPERVWQALKGH